MDYDTLLSGCCEVARELLRHGAEIQRAEDTMRRLLAAYGLEHGPGGGGIRHPQLRVGQRPGAGRPGVHGDAPGALFHAEYRGH